MSRPSDTLVRQAHAKLNLFLRVLGRREDGYHDIQTVVVPIDLSDGIEIHADAGREFRTLALSLQILGAPELAEDVPGDDSNLVLVAASALAERIGARGFADIRLDKRIPSAAGLGGGSADATATLLALNELWWANLGLDELARVGARVGSDVPALMQGVPVFVEGRGERVRPIQIPALRWALVTFRFGVSAADAYRWWDEAGGPAGPDPGALPEAAHTPEKLLRNDLEEPVMDRHPEVRRAKEVLLEGGAAGAVMSGSGPSVAGLLTQERATLAESVERELRTRGAKVRYVTSAGGEGRT